MNNILQMVENEQTSEFYPTPEKLVEKMLEGVDLKMIKTILEPSAGKGDILRVLAANDNTIYGRIKFDVDCIEIDPNLRAILKYNFGERKKEIRNKINEIRGKYKYCYPNSYTYYNEDLRESVKLPPKDLTKLKELEKEEETFFEKGIHIIHDNFLTYTPFKKYDLIIMNPPFSNGDRHLLKALEIQKNGGNIICLLNAETLKNPYTETRRELLKQLNKYNASIEYIDNAFTTAERKTGVEVALIKVSIEEVQEESDIYNRLKEAEQMEDIDVTTTDIEVSDFIKSILAHYKVEVKAGIELIRQYRALIPYIQSNFDAEDKYKSPLLELRNLQGGNYSKVSINEYLKDVRMKYWRALLKNPKFTEKLTSKLQNEYYEKVSKFADYDFTEFNIKTLTTEMNTQIKKGIEDEIIVMFDRLTEEHSFYPECQKNRHLFDGWKTNKAHKIDKKVIIPCYGIFDSWDGKPRTYNAYKVLADIERILDFLDGKRTEDLNMEVSIDAHFRQGVTKNIPCKYFEATFYKKGTVHLVFTCPELIDRFNIYAAQYKQWLPPSYGKKAYKNMSDEEKAVINSFQGEKVYNDIMAKSDYYLAPATDNMLLLT